MRVERSCARCLRVVQEDATTRGYVSCSCGALVWFEGIGPFMLAADGRHLHTVAEEVAELERWWVLS